MTTTPTFHAAPTRPVRRLWIAATAPELSCVPLQGGASFEHPWTGFLHDDDAGLVTGCGPTAGAALAWFLARFETSEIVGIGIAGAYPGSICRMGGVYRIRTERFIDIGAESGIADGIEELPFPGLAPETFALSCFPDLEHLDSAEAATTALATGTAQTALRRRSGGMDLESMEGAAWAQVARRAGVPFAQVRAVSNVAGPRDRQTWHVAGALAALRRTLEPHRHEVLP